jgi:hypothetical protein
MRIRLRHLLLVTLVALPATVAAQLPRFGTETYTLEGIAATDRDGARTAGWFPVSVGIVGDPSPARWVGVTAFLPWNGDPFIGRQDLRRLLPASPTLLFTGPRDLVRQFQEAPAGSRLVVRGMLNRASRNFMLSAIKVTPSGAAAKQ